MVAPASRVADDNNQAKLKGRLRDSISLIVKNKEYRMEWYAIGNPSEPDHATCLRELRDRDSPLLLLGSAAFNPAAAGVIDISSPNRLETLSDAFKRYERNVLSVHQREGPENTLELIYVYPESFRRVVTIDRNHGLTITRVSLTRHDGAGIELPAPRIESSAKWELREDVWLPVTTSWFFLTIDETLAQVEYTIEWERIKPQSLEDSLFDYKSFDGFWPNLDLVDVRNGKTVLLESSNKPEDYVLNDPEQANSPVVDQHRFERRGSRGQMSWYVLVNAFLVCGALLAIFFRKRAKNDHGDIYEEWIVKRLRSRK